MPGSGSITCTWPWTTTHASRSWKCIEDEKGATCAGFLERAAAFMAAHGAPVKRVMTDNAFVYRLSGLGAKHILIKPRHPWQNGKAERFNRTLQEGWAYRHVFTSNQARTEALKPWLDFYNNHRPHSSLGGKTPITRVTNVMS